MPPYALEIVPYPAFSRIGLSSLGVLYCSELGESFFFSLPSFLPSAAALRRILIMAEVDISGLDLGFFFLGCLPPFLTLSFGIFTRNLLKLTFSECLSIFSASVLCIPVGYYIQ